MSDPKTWVPYWNTRDCSQGFCTLYCPQWCYNKIAPPPPSIESHGHDHSARPYFSPLIIAIIGILASGFILISYYAVMSKYCRNRIPSSEPNTGLELEQNPDHLSSHDQAPNAGKNGLDEDRIKSIAVFKCRKGDGVVDGSDCSVCLSEFREDDSLRLLPTCRHAFHLPCIDTWLKSHSNCPLCRANIIVSPEFSTTDDDVRETSEQQPEIPAVGDNLLRQTHVISIPDNNNNNNQEIIRRSMSMNYAFNQGRLSVADILRIDDQDSDQFPDSQLRHTLSLSRAKFLFPMLNRGRLATIPF